MRLTEVAPSLDGGHIKGSEPLEGRASQTLLEQADQQSLVSLKLSEISAVRSQMGNGAASTIILVEVRDVEFRWEHCLWKIAEVLKLVGLAITALD